jgi:hypothetical protein
MIKFKGTDGQGGTVLGLGLSRVNVAFLTEGKPILVHGKDLGMPELASIVIFFGETERDLVAELNKRGALGPDTIVHPMPTAEPEHAPGAARSEIRETMRATRAAGIVCPHAKSDTTPCVLMDGEVARADDGVCVGCERRVPAFASMAERRRYVQQARP